MSNHALDQFQKYLTTHNKSSNTICVYHYTVRQFYHLYPQLTLRNLQLYKVYFLEHYRPQTVSLHIRALSCYVEYGQTSITPVSMIKIQQKTYLDKIISQAGYEYLKQCLVGSEEHTYYPIVCFIIATGVCISELITLQIEDVYTGHKDVYSKGNKIRRVYIPHGLAHGLQEWLATIHQSTGSLFLNRFHSPVSPSGIRAQFEVFATRCSLDPEVVYLHSFRHCFARNFIEGCGDIFLLPDPLGHESIGTTRICPWRSSSEQHRIVNKVMDWQGTRHEGV